MIEVELVLETTRDFRSFPGRKARAQNREEGNFHMAGELCYKIELYSIGYTAEVGVNC